MAKIISFPVAGHDPDSEVKVYRALKLLGDAWTVIHSVGWLGQRGNRIGDGEADFVLIHRDHGIVVIEVKGGGVNVEHGRWSSIDRYGHAHPIKNPYEQALESKVTLHKWLKDQRGLPVPTCHVVALPDIHTVAEIGPAAPVTITISARDLANPESAILRALKHWEQAAALTDEQIKKICDALAPTLVIRRKLSDHALDAEAGLIVLTDEQVRAFQLTRHTSRAVVFGGAGTGKSVLACEKARQLRDDGNRVLLTCYNGLLSRSLEADSSLDGVVVQSFHSLCISLARKAGLKVNTAEDSDWWTNEAPLLLIDAAEKTHTSFDAVVVDEGQDFTQGWIEALEAICTSDGASPFYIFADENQTLWERDWVPDATRARLDLSINCRNSRPISEKVAAILAHATNDRGVTGPDPKWTDLVSAKDAPKIVQRQVERLQDEGFANNQIVVLCEDAGISKKLHQMAVGDTGFCEFGGNGVVAESIERFKGLEAVAVILILDGPVRDRPDKLAYVGLSRARSYLQVLGHPNRKRSLGWTT
ncbi:NERD domain-containing protein [Rhizobium johnstonii]|uniref:NERD domain-containing protein n=1 Tax=Rhizobium johnstonii TaxID=3019933 RepID=UPI003F987137